MNSAKRAGNHPLQKGNNLFRLGKTRGLLLLCLLWAAYGFGQTPLDTAIFDPTKNVLENAKSLNYFFDKLIWLDNQKVGQVQVLHVGDSHIQADMITKPIRVGLQQRFGNAGRGLVFPHAIVKSNGSASVRGSAKGIWTGARNVQYQYRQYTGISGFYATTTDPNAAITLKVNNKDSMDYSFAYATVFCQTGPQNFTLLAGDSANIGYLRTRPVDDLVNSPDAKVGKDNIAFKNIANYPTEYVVLQNLKTDTAQKSTTIYGVVLKKGGPGILYNVAGVNGAHYADWASAPLFFTQAQVLGADLVVVSLGTNEAFGPAFDTLRFYKQIDSLMTGLMGIYPPQTAFILTTPPDCFKKKKYPQPNLPLVVKTIRRYAADYNMAVWDMYAMTGGFGSRAKWRKYGLMAGDGVHFTRAGYDMQGRMFLQAFLNAYTDYKAGNPNPKNPQR